MHFPVLFFVYGFLHILVDIACHKVFVAIFGEYVCPRCGNRILAGMEQRHTCPACYLPMPLYGHTLENQPTKTALASNVKSPPTVSTYVAERKWSADQEIIVHEDGSVTLTMSATSEREVIAWVLGFGKEATLLEPQELRTKMASEIAVMQERYG